MLSTVSCLRFECERRKVVTSNASLALQKDRMNEFVGRPAYSPQPKSPLLVPADYDANFLGALHSRDRIRPARSS